MNFARDAMDSRRAKYISQKLLYKGISYSVAWVGVFGTSARLNLLLKHISILKKEHSKGENTKDFLFCTLYRSRGKLKAIKLPQHNPFEKVKFKLNLLKNNIELVDLSDISFRAMLPRYPLHCFHASNKCRHRTLLPAFKGWISSEDTTMDILSFEESALRELIPYEAHGIVRKVLFK